MRSRLLTLLLLACASLSSYHCGITQPVRVLDEGATQCAASFGGPFIPIGSAVVPVPYLNAGLVHGWTRDLTVSGNVHLLPMLFGDVGLDAGIAASLLKQRGAVPEVTAKAMVMFFTDFRGGMHPRLYPLASLNASYLVGTSSLLYAGADNLYQLNPPHWLLSPFAGYQFPLGTRWTAQGEAKWMAANVNTAHGVAEGQTNIGDYGNAAVFLGFLYALGGGK